MILCVVVVSSLVLEIVNSAVNVCSKLIGSFEVVPLASVPTVI